VDWQRSLHPARCSTSTATAPSRSRGSIGDGGNFLRGQCPPPGYDVVEVPGEKAAAHVPVCETERRIAGRDVRWSRRLIRDAALYRLMRSALASNNGRNVVPATRFHATALSSNVVRQWRRPVREDESRLSQLSIQVDLTDDDLESEHATLPTRQQ
jgi:hypothetical protein